MSIFASLKQLTASGPQCLCFMVPIRHIWNSRHKTILFSIYLLSLIHATLSSFPALTPPSHSCRKGREVFLASLASPSDVPSITLSLFQVGPQDPVLALDQVFSFGLAYPKVLTGSSMLTIAQTLAVITRFSNYFCNLSLTHTS